MTVSDEYAVQNLEKLEALQISIANLEVELHNRGELSVAEIVHFLVEWRLTSAIFDSIQTDAPAASADNYLSTIATRAAALLSLWASGEDLALTHDELNDLIVFKVDFAKLFYVSGFRGFQHLKYYLTLKSANGLLTLPQNKLIVYFLLIPLDEITEADFESARKLPPNIYVSLMLGWLNDNMVTTVAADAARRQMYIDSDILQQVHPTQIFVEYVFSAWMLCCYAETPERLRFRRNINQMIVNFLTKSGYAQKPLLPRPQRQKPRLLVIHEHIQNNHVMYRCYGPYFKQMAENFELLSMAPTPLPEELTGVFSEHVLIENARDGLFDLIDKIHALTPDIIYYPGIGLQLFTGFLCNLRLAPMQVMSASQPDSSQSKVIDFCAVGAKFNYPKHEISEKIISIEPFTFQHFWLPELRGLALTVNPQDDGVFHIAINASQMKMHPSFLECLKKIYQEYPGQVLFHFFPGLRTYALAAFKTRIKKLFPASKIYPAASYEDFMSLMARCHLSLSPFPFGSTNSIFDATIIGLPVVALRSPRLSGQMDYQVQKALGLESFGIASSKEEYVQMIRDLIDKPEVYQAHRQAVKDAVEHYLATHEEQNYDPSLADAILATYKRFQAKTKAQQFCWDGAKLIELKR